MQTLNFHFDAILDFSQTILNEPDDANLYYGRGHLKMIICEFEDAVNDHRKALELTQILNDKNKSLNFIAIELGWESAALFYQNQLEICIRRKNDFEQDKVMNEILKRRAKNIRRRKI